MSQMTMFGVSPTKTGSFNVYHDESGTDQDHARFQLHGALFMPHEHLQKSFSLLQSSRMGENGRIHFVNLRDKHNASKRRIANSWLDIYFSQLVENCYFKCIIVDTKSSAFDPNRFLEKFHLYNFAAMMAVYSGIIWSFKSFDQIDLRVFSEERTRPKDDNFVKYLPGELLRRLKSKAGKAGYPQLIEPNSKVRLIDGNPSKVTEDDKIHCEFIQLTDMLTSAVAQAVNAKAKQEIKLQLAKELASLIEDVRLPPWLQEVNLHRRFSVSCFPDSKGDFYNVPLAIRGYEQPKLIEDR